AEPKRLIEVDQMKERCRISEHSGTTFAVDWTDVAHLRSVQSRLHELLEIVAVLDDPGDQQRHADPLGDVDRLGGSLVRVDPSEEQEVTTVTGPKIELADVDPVVDRRRVVELVVPVSFADCDVVADVVVALVDGQD